MNIEIKDQTVFLASGGNFQVRYTIACGDQKMTRSEWRISAIEAIHRAAELSLQSMVCDVSVCEHWHVPCSKPIGTASGGVFLMDKEAVK